MKAITLRNLSPEVAKIIQKRAKEQRTCVNKAIIGLLEESVGKKPGKKEKVRYHDLDHLAGGPGQRKRPKSLKNSSPSNEPLIQIFGVVSSRGVNRQREEEPAAFVRDAFDPDAASV